MANRDRCRASGPLDADDLQACVGNSFARCAVRADARDDVYGFHLSPWLDPLGRRAYVDRVAVLVDLRDFLVISAMTPAAR